MSQVAVPSELVRTAWAACLVISVSGHFDDEADRQAMAQLAMQIEHAHDLTGLNLDDTGCATQALISAFEDLQGGQALDDGALAALMTPERLALAHATLCVQYGALVDAQDALMTTLLASAALSLFRLDIQLVRTPEAREDRRQLTAVRDTVEALLLAGSPPIFTPTEEYLLRQSLIGSARLLIDEPGLVARVQMADDLRAHLTAGHLDTAYRALVARQAGDLVGIA